MSLEREAMAAAAAYRDQVASTVRVATLLLWPPEKAGVVLKALRGQLYAHRGIRNAVDFCAAGDAPSSTHSGASPSPAAVASGRAAYTCANHSDRVYNILVPAPTPCGAATVKGLLLDPSVVDAATIDPSAPLFETLLALPLTPERAAEVGLPAALAEQLNAAAASAGQAPRKSEAKDAAPSRPMMVGVTTVEVALRYTNYTMPELLRMVLRAAASPDEEAVDPAEKKRRDCASSGMNNAVNSPSNLVALSGFEQVGHIAHVNLSAAHRPHKHVIGQVILDCNPTVAVVVNKTEAITSQFREFPMEVIAMAAELPGGRATAALSEDELLTATVKQHGCVFAVPYNRVYWNSRLSHEHTRLVGMMRPGDTLFDVMAGVGPFAVPAARAGVVVYANDLNPASAEFMVVNRDRNGVDAAALTVFNRDGRDFMNKVLYDAVMGLMPLPQSHHGRRKHVVMNLPATAVEFLDVFAPAIHHTASTSINNIGDDGSDGCDAVRLPALPGSAATGVEAGVELMEGWYRRHRWNYRPAGAASAPAIDRSVLIHVYCFAPAANPLEEAVRSVEHYLGYPLEEKNKECVFLVRDVSPQKRMVCVSFTLPDAFWAHQAEVAVTGSSSHSTGASGGDSPRRSKPRTE